MLCHWQSTCNELRSTRLTFLNGAKRGARTSKGFWSPRRSLLCWSIRIATLRPSSSSSFVRLILIDLLTRKGCSANCSKSHRRMINKLDNSIRPIWIRMSCWKQGWSLRGARRWLRSKSRVSSIVFRMTHFKASRRIRTPSPRQEGGFRECGGRWRAPTCSTSQPMSQETMHQMAKANFQITSLRPLI